MSKIIDFRSDTVTKPSKEMLEAIVNARVGDDEYSEDPEVNELQEYCASLFGMEAGLFVTSGQMGNQLAISVLTNPGDEIICSEGAHILNYEKAAAAQLSGVQIRPIASTDGMFSKESIKEVIERSEYHLPTISLLSWENTHLYSGGSILNHDMFISVSEYAKEKELDVHVDGARIWHSILECNINPKEIGKTIDSLTFCFSKGLGAPVGSMLLGKKDFISKARELRKVRGGGMRQVGVIAAAAKYALESKEKLLDDHFKANQIAAYFIKNSYSGLDEVIYKGTNMVFLSFEKEKNADMFVDNLKDKGVRLATITPKVVRIVTHLDISKEDVERFISILEER
ncbi:MAG: GntG family PLP-dependent aldolase [Actinomycetota bacterium]|nr:GntG family PLP-dependent aldolase [Actinomycetota bacterium]